MIALGKTAHGGLVITGFLALSALAVQGADAKPVDGAAGTWKGTINAGGQELHLVVHISKKADGSLTGTLDSPDQGAKDIPIEDITWKDGKFGFALKAIKASYEGKANDSGSEVTGEWKQSGQSLPLTLKREK